MQNLNQNSPLQLADALADEIAKTPAEALLSEVAEDLGDRRALAVHFDIVVARAVRRSRRTQIATAVKKATAWLTQRLFGKPMLVRVGTFATLLIAVVGYHYHDARRATRQVESLNLRAPSPRQTLMPPSFLALSNDDPAGRPASAAANIPAAPVPSPPTQSDLRRALAAYDTARAYEAKIRATTALDRGDYAAAIGSLNKALRSCADRCQPELRAELDSHLERAQSALKSGTSVALAAPAPDAVNAVAAAAPAKSSPSLAWPANGRITVSFGGRAAALAHSPAQVQARTAEGITIAVPGSADIRAAADGVVSYVGGDTESGKFLLIRHGSDLRTGYGRLRRVLVKVPDQVHRGEVIAKGVVSSGGAEPQLYFEVRRGTVPIDPMQYLPKGQQH